MLQKKKKLEHAVCVSGLKLSACWCSLVSEGAALRPAEMLQPSSGFFFSLLFFLKKVSGPSAADHRSATTTLFLLQCRNELMVNSGHDGAIVRWWAGWQQLIFRLMRRKGRNLHPEEHFPTPCRSPMCKASSLNPPPSIPRVQVVQSNIETSTKFFFQVARWRVSHQEVAFLVQSQVVRAGEAAFTVGALERLDPCVLAEVSRQLVRTGELPCAAFPHALVGFLACKWGDKTRIRSVKKACKRRLHVLEKQSSRVWIRTLTGVRPAVCFEVGALGVHFVAAGEVAAVNSPLFQWVRRVSRERMLRARMNYYWRVVTPKRDTEKIVC